MRSGLLQRQRRPSGTLLRRARPRVALLGALAAALLVAAACGGSSGGGSSNDTSAAGAPHSGGTFTFQVGGSPDGLDAGQVSTRIGEEITNQIYAELVYKTREGKFEPWLATKWTSNQDATVWTFDLRHDVTFQDGTPFDAAAVCYNFDRVVSPELHSTGAGIVIGPYKSCTETSKYSVKVTFTEGYAPFLNAVSTPLMGMVSPTAAKAGGKNFNVNPVKAGAGPFEFVKWVKNDQVVLKRWDGYKWPPSGSGHSGPAYLDKIVFKIVPQASVRVGAVRSDQAGAAEDVPPTQYKQLESDKNLHIDNIGEQIATWSYVFNLSHSPWNQKQLREAVRDALDVPAMLKTVYLGTRDRAWSPISPGVQYYDASLENSWKSDIAAAKTALDELGWKAGSDGYRHKDGKTLTLRNINVSPDVDFRQELDTIMQEQLKAVGIKVTLQNMPVAREFSTIEHGDYDIVGQQLGLNSPDVMFDLYHSKFIPSPKGLGFNWAQLKDSEVDSLLVKARQTTDTAQRKSDYSTVQKKIVDNVWSIPLYVPAYTVVSRTSVHGLNYISGAYPDFYGVWLS